MNPNIKWNFQICISVPLNFKIYGAIMRSNNNSK